jgi:predicted metal-dependent hydrolase
MAGRRLSLTSGEVNIDIVRSSRRTVALYVRPGGTLLIRAPWYVPVRMLMQFAADKRPWIEKQIRKLRDVTPPGTPLQVSDGQTIPFLGHDLIINVLLGDRRMLKPEEGRLLLTVPAGSTSGELSRMTEAWYLREAKKYLPDRTYRLARMHPDLLPEPVNVNVRKMKRRWGTCHSNGTIWLNRELMKKAPELIDYVIIHELCHLVHHNHGREYYELLGRIMPDFQMLRKRLQNG